MLDTQNQGPQCIDQQKESSMALRIRQHDRNPNLWWVSSPEDDVAYIARPGNHYRAWTTYGWPGHANLAETSASRIPGAWIVKSSRMLPLVSFHAV